LKIDLKLPKKRRISSMKFLRHLSITFFTIMLLLCISSCNGDNGTISPSNEPAIEFTYVPLCGSFDNLKGKVMNVEPTDYFIAVFIYVPEGWWTKPTLDNPLTTISNDGNWECDITTGGIDEQATEIVAYLIPKSYEPTLMKGNSNLPKELDDSSLAKVQITREPNVRTISFSGYEWKVKTSENPVGPGPNLFSDSTENVWIDNQDQLHLKITNRNGKWYCAEVISQKSFGYGEYIFYTASRVDKLNENVVLGLFTWSDDTEYNHREIDIEFSRWGQPANDNAQFVVQPYNRTENMYRFNAQLSEDNSTHSFDWRSDIISFQSIHGHYATPPDSSYIIESWNYTGEDIPTPGNENARINLWLFNSIPPSDSKEVEVIIKKFEFIP
jgi:hypothetical protein